MCESLTVWAVHRRRGLHRSVRVHVAIQGNLLGVVLGPRTSSSYMYNTPALHGRMRHKHKGSMNLCSFVSCTHLAILFCLPPANIHVIQRDYTAMGMVFFFFLSDNPPVLCCLVLQVGRFQCWIRTGQLQVRCS